MEADANIGKSLYDRASGYTHPEVKLFTQYEEGELKVIEHEIAKHYPPDVTAMIFWLKNRHPDKWRDKQEIEHTGDESKPIVVRNVDDKKALEEDYN